MTIRTIEKTLREAGIEDWSFEALTLAEHFGGKTKAYLVAFPDSDIESDELEKAVMRRADREPLQYILGEWSFMGLDFYVSPACLIPRQDTELITNLAIEHLKNGGKYADLCTGSGCIAISVLNYSGKISGNAYDISGEAVEIARKNAERNKVSDRLKIFEADVTTDVLDGEYEVITTNPPYVTKDEMLHIEKELTYEPRMALTDEKDGMSIIESIIEIYPRHLTETGVLLIEIGASQGNKVLDIANDKNLNCKIEKDLNGHDRVAVIRRK